MITIAETPSFQRKAENLLSPAEKSALIAYLAEHPRAGAIIPGTGGLRKLRWGRSDRGKRGGTRVIYYYHNDSMPLYLLAIFGKNERTDLSAKERTLLAKLVERLVKHWTESHT